MTPAKLQALVDMDDYARNLSEKAPQGQPATRSPSKNRAADLAALARL